MAYTIEPKASDFIGYPFEEYTTVANELFYKACPTGQSSEGIRYSKTYTSYISQQDALRLRDEDSVNYNSEGQAYANANGTCSSGCIPETTVVLPSKFHGITSNNIYGFANGSSFVYPRSIIDSKGSFNIQASINSSKIGSYMTSPTVSTIYYNPYTSIITQYKTLHFDKFTPGSPCSQWSSADILIGLDGLLATQGDYGNNNISKSTYYLYEGLGGPEGIIYVTISTKKLYKVWYKNLVSGSITQIGSMVPNSSYEYGGYGVDTQPYHQNDINIGHGDGSIVISIKSWSPSDVFQPAKRRVQIYEVLTNVSREPSSINEIYNDFTTSRDLMLLDIVTFSGMIVLSYYSSDTGNKLLVLGGDIPTPPQSPRILDMQSIGNTLYAIASGSGIIRYTKGGSWQ